MLRATLIVLWLLSPGWVFAGEKVAEETSKKPKMDVRTVKAETDSLSLALTLPKKAVAGQPVLCTVVVKNIGKKTLVYRESTAVGCFEWSVTTRRGRCRLTEHGELQIGVDGDAENLTISKKLGVGKSIVLSFNLARVYDLTMAGQYKVSVKRSFQVENFKGKEVSVETEPVKLPVGDPPPIGKPDEASEKPATNVEILKKMELLKKGD